MRPYIVRQGEHLIGIAARLGFDADEVWNDAQNEELREERGSGQVLAPGDVLFVPEPTEEPCGLDPETLNRYEVTMPKVVIRFQLRAERQILADEPYRIDGLRMPLTGTSDGDGMIEEEIPAQVRSVRVTLTERDHAFDVVIGHLDPVSQRSGVLQRLRNSGWMPHLDDLEQRSGSSVRRRDDEDRDMAAAIRRLQAEHGLEQTGELDDETRRALEQGS